MTTKQYPTNISFLAPNVMTFLHTNWTASTVICGHLISAILGKEEFSLTEHTSVMNAGKAETVTCYLSESQDKLTGELLKLPGGRSHT
jgi:hypothetical protein